MLKKLQKQLTFIFIFFTSAISLMTTMITLQSAQRQLLVSNENVFMSNFHSLASRLQSAQTIEDVWLAQSERGSYIIYIEDNGEPLQFPGSWESKTSRQILIERSHQLAKEEYSIDADKIPSNNDSISSSSFVVEGDHGDSYLAVVDLIPAGKGYRSITLLHDLSYLNHALIRQRLIYFSIALLGIVLLTFFGYYFVKRAIRSIEINQQKQNEFIAAASHELRSPLAVISASASAIQLSENKEEKENFASAIQRECSRTARLVDDLLLLANADAQNLSMRHENVDIETILIECMENFMGIAAQKNIHIEVDLPESSINPIKGDRGRVTQLLAILMDNAINYSPESSSIVLRVNSHGSNVRMQIIDHGIGISDKDKTHVFDRFYRADSSRSKKEHYGLGLSIASEIVHLHEGKLSLVDTPGGGLTVVVDFPY